MKALNQKLKQIPNRRAKREKKRIRRISLKHPKRKLAKPTKKNL